MVVALWSSRVPGETAPAELIIDRFSKENQTGEPPRGWQELTFKKIKNHTRYTVIQEGSNSCLRAESHKSASGIFKEVTVSAKEYPILRWRWKVEGVLEKADAVKKSGDDYAARIYVAFKYDPETAGAWEKAKYGAAKALYGKYPPKGALNYVWDNRLPAGTTIDNAYTDRAKMIVVKSGKEKVGKWVSEEANVYEDYRKLFGVEPPEIEFIAIMTDTDNTGESAVAYFDDIVLKTR